MFTQSPAVYRYVMAIVGSMLSLSMYTVSVVVVIDYSLYRFRHTHTHWIGMDGNGMKWTGWMGWDWIGARINLHSNKEGSIGFFSFLTLFVYALGKGTTC